MKVKILALVVAALAAGVPADGTTKHVRVSAE
jgi:hypothetical protein